MNNERIIQAIAKSLGCTAEIVRTGDQMPDLKPHAETTHEREAAQADSRFLTVAQLQGAQS